ncbi:Phosphate-binding DING protein [Pseudomonas chlororaphis subsp. aurantiaca]|uniref:substrate-binding domain-containing protein n=1 Tax=Pseudomonas chlororaphis TaxID=587753 RepID=UPI000F6F5F13|nr:substrate-binding domain-containing protein [Pseudomonas chlororaphis]AZD35665.1 Phosphate-binding DING protein [Pseudomonas chlororaphis subsp. aurantiaca]AZD41999.1 Phosphate-binding DING protein [Pseudomonas chlororaphis subsp. aurantiaca]
MMLKYGLMAVSCGMALGAAQAMAAVVGGGSSLPMKLYGTAIGDGILTASYPGFQPYIGRSSGEGKAAFFSNDATKLRLAAGTAIDYAGSDSIVSLAERDAYNSSATVGRASFGPLIQIPVAATTVAIPYHVSGKTALNLTSAQLADIFSGKIQSWHQVLFDGVGGPYLPIKVIYRTDGSGTTQILTTHLRTVKPASVPGNSINFATAVGFNPATNAPAGSTYIGVSGSEAVASTVASTDGAIGYISPDFTDFDNAAVVASVNGFLPAGAIVQLTLDTELPPTHPSSGKNPANPLDWVPTFPNPSYGYPIIGYTNMILSQCYKDQGDTIRIRAFINSHYSGQNNSAVTNHSFIPLPAMWQSAVHDTFYNASSSLRVGNPDVCNGIGRPL